MKIYKINPNFYLGDVLEYPDDEDGIPYGYTRKAPPEKPESDNMLYAKWSGSDWYYIEEAPQEETPVVSNIISKLEFLNRLGDDEYVAVLTASKSDVVVEAWLNKFNLMAVIDLSDTKIQNGLSMLVSKNLITQQKADSIISG